MNLRQLEYFVRVAELGSFSKAGVVLGVAQPALSRQVRQLETDLRQALLLRTGRGVTLTEAGKRLFEHSVGILQLVERAREDVEASRGEPLGRVVVGLPPSMGRLLAVDLVERFRERLPRARLAIVEGLSAHITEWIATGRVDVGLLHNPEPGGAIEIVPVLDEPLCLVGPASVQARGPVPFAQLCAHPLIIPERSHAIRRLLEAQAALSGVKLEVACEVSSVPVILDLVRRGHGCAVLAESALGAGAREFAARPIAEPRLTTTLCLATSANKPATPLIKRTVALLRELLLAHVPGARRRPAGRARSR